MSIEAYEVSYQGNTNERFKNALLDSVMRPAYERAKSYAILSDDPNMLEMRSVHQYVEGGPVHVYTVYTAQDEPRMDILAEMYFVPGDMTWQEIDSLRVDILTRHGIDEKFKDELRNLTATDLMELSGFSYIHEARYEIDMADRTLSTTTELACRINGQRFVLNGSATELDEDRQMVFDAEEVVDIIRALHSTLLVSEAQVRTFLDVDF